MRVLRLLAVMLLGVVSTAAQTGDNARSYTQDNPLIYEDVWDLWPYSFLNEHGQPDGFNVDLIKLLMKELDIPYVIKMKPSAEAFRDLRDGKSDLMLGLAVGFHDEFGHYSKNAVTLFTQSLVRPKSQPLTVQRFHDLSSQKVIVNDSSLAHHLMIEYGWGENARPVEDMREAIQAVSAKEEGQIVWNTLSLKWLMRRYHTDNLELTPVNMQHGQYKFMSNDQHLLDLLDKAYTQLYSTDKITPLQDKWFYPEREEEPIRPWVWALIGGISLLVLFLSIYGITYRRLARRLTEQNEKRNKRLALILETSHVHMWTYDINSQQFAWRNNNGQVAYTYTMDEFSHRYSPEDFLRLRESLDQLARQPQGQEKNIAIELKAKDTEDGSTELRDYYIVLSVLDRDKEGKPTVLLGTKKDVTDERRRQRFSDEQTLRYWSIFYTPIVGILLFDKDGILTNINPKASELLSCDAEETIARHVSMDGLLHTGALDMQEADGYRGTLTGAANLEYELMTVYNDAHEAVGMFAVLKDCSNIEDISEQHQLVANELKKVKERLAKCHEDLGCVLRDRDIRMVTYSPTEHLLTIYGSMDEVQHALTQTRCMTLVDDRSKKVAMRMLNDMDTRTNRVVNAHIHTTLRTREHRKLCMDFNLMPVSDGEGTVTSYVGLLQDTSEQCEITMEMELLTAKVQEVEQTKNSFVKNMVQEIKKPMSTITGYVAQLGDEAPIAHEEVMHKGIIDNSDYLLHLIDNILYLSRLEAHMVEIKKQPCNFAEVFEALCARGWGKYQQHDTLYVVDNPYTQLTVELDAENLGHAIAQLTANAAQHTTQGVVRARYEYIGRRLIISIDDTGEGIPQDELARIQAYDGKSPHSTKGLGLAICRELVTQMKGTMEIISEEGSGTTVYVTIPCLASEIKRKKTFNNSL